MYDIESNNFSLSFCVTDYGETPSDEDECYCVHCCADYEAHVVGSRGFVVEDEEVQGGSAGEGEDHIDSPCAVDVGAAVEGVEALEGEGPDTPHTWA